MNTPTDDYPQLQSALRTDINGSPLAPSDIAAVERYGERGYQDYAEVELAAIARLKDGRFAAIEAWCDTTGWGCQDGCDVAVFNTFDEAWNNGLTNSGRTLAASGSRLPDE